MIGGIGSNYFSNNAAGVQNSSFKERIETLKQSRQQVLAGSSNRPSIVISGGGPAGLIRAIDALVTGNPVTVIEKRKQDARARDNTVALGVDTVPLLKFYGVYQYLLENGLIFPERGGDFNVRLADLETAMKAVISQITPEKIIYFESTIERVNSYPGAKADIIVSSPSGAKNFNAIDLLVVAEGAHSPTNQLLGNRRVSVLPSIPVIAAIFKDDRPQIRGVSTFFQYIGKSLANTATSVYYYTIFFFKVVFQGEHIFNKNRKIAGSLVLRTPNQNYLGSGLSKKETEIMKQVIQKLENAQEELEAAKKQNYSQERLAPLNEKVKVAQKEWDRYMKYWTGISFCSANIFGILASIFGRQKLDFASWLPLDHLSITEIGADKSDIYSGKIGQSSFLVAGDSLATVDPTTGLGCNTAVRTATDFHDYVAGLNSKQDIASLQKNYNTNCEAIISNNHEESKRFRLAYRPDAVDV